MKKTIIILAALIFVTSTYASDISVKEKEEIIIAENKAILCEASKNRTWIFETSTNWTAGNLAYGPLELIAGAGAPVVGALVGFGVGAVIPSFFMKKGSEILLPATISCGAAAGAACGLAITPICAVEGAFDTLTGGAFADGYFSWINTDHLKGISMNTVQDEIIDQSSD
ncbi:hypothetical protein KAH27_01195 [bacterium]|nr:hypothetical protein [bacterium]